MGYLPTPGVGQGDFVGDFFRFATEIEQAHRLIVDEFIKVMLAAQEILHRVRAPDRPVMLGDQDGRGGTETINRLGEIMRPHARVTHHRTAQGKEIMQMAGGVFGDVEHAEAGEEQVHFRRCLGFRGELEDDFDAVDDVGFDWISDQLGWRDQALGAARGGFA